VVTAITAATYENERKRGVFQGGGGTGQGGRGAAHCAKMEGGGVRKLASEREGREGEAGGATGGQRRGRMEGRRGS
jgi:hypothetical protein